MIFHIIDIFMQTIKQYDIILLETVMICYSSYKIVEANIQINT